VPTVDTIDSVTGRRLKLALVDPVTGAAVPSERIRTRPRPGAHEFFYDFRSPYSYLAYTQLCEMDVDVALRPMKILKVMELVGNTPTTITCAAKGRLRACRPDALGAAI
jgi:hypothetical protein